MRHLPILALCISTALSLDCYAAWVQKNYVDEFNLPTEKTYVTNDTYFEGLFDNHIVDDAPLYASCLIDQDNIGFTLYEYQKRKAENIFSERERYKVTVLDRDQQKHYMAGYFPAKRQRFYLDSRYRNEFLTLVKDKAQLVVLFAGKDDPAVKYKFVIPEDENFSTLIEVPNYYFGDGQTEELIFDRDLRRTDEHEMIVGAQTNLPDGFKVQIKLERSFYYSSSGEVIVKDGYFGLRFPKDSRSLDGDHEYKVTYVFDMEEQSEDIRAIVGDNFQKYTGYEAEEIQETGMYDLSYPFYF